MTRSHLSVFEGSLKGNILAAGITLELKQIDKCACEPVELDKPTLVMMRSTNGALEWDSIMFLNVSTRNIHAE
ncbi:unnamed protein product [Echinostoma caproni]|uniref:Uncharacterized protein n=1 Tax=Echinostoma caproni TaxID=27848 RepID=A0A183AWY0_9TREM|nr:unnamed protein product [Echinostoma caproni]